MQTPQESTGANVDQRDDDGEMSGKSFGSAFGGAPRLKLRTRSLTCQKEYMGWWPPHIGGLKKYGTIRPLGLITRP